jgi:hypothetical protein
MSTRKCKNNSSNWFFMLTTLLFSFSACSGCSESLPTEQALKKVTLMGEYDTSSFERKRCQVFIYSEASTYEERAHTTLYFAEQYLKAKDLDYAQVFHLPIPHEALVGKGPYIAQAQYSPDGGGVSGDSPLEHGTWEAEAVEGEVDKAQAGIAAMYELIKDDLQKEDELGSYTDEDAVRKEISRRLEGKVAPEDCRVPIYFTKQL